MKENLYYVGLGASAGGLESLEKFFKNIPSDTGLVFIVIQHLSPDYKSLMNELLARHTKMEIHIAEERMEALPNNIYLIPPRTNLSIFHGKLFLEKQKQQKHHIALPIDYFFRSLAKDQGENAIGIILSGTGSDGTLGVKAIKGTGGLVIAQDQKSAKFDGMPKSSINTGVVDYILPPEQMPEKLVEFVNYPSLRKAFLEESESENENLDDLTKINLLLRNHASVDFSKYKKSTMIRRIDRRVVINKCHSIPEYIEFLSESDEEKETLFKEMLIGVTNFFRNKEAYDSLRKNVLPNLDYSKKEIRIWSAGCSTGEEAYSLTIMISEYLSANSINCDIKCFATDIDEAALEVAGSGLYPESIIADLDAEIISKYFVKNENGYRVNEFIRKKVVFAKHNLLNDPPFSRLDLLSCRNLFIYFKSEYQQEILRGFYYSLRDKGYLFLGNSESLGKISEAFEIIDNKWKIFKFKKGYQPSISEKLHVSSNISHLKTYERRAVKSDQSMWYEKLLLKVLLINGPPSVIVDEDDNIIQVLGDVSKYMKIQSGRFSNKLTSNISKGLGLFVKNIMRRLKVTRESLVLNNIEGLDEKNPVISIKGEIIQVNHNDYFYISFLEGKTHDKKEPIEINMTEDEKDRIETLETELQQAREGLQATIEELETSNEELQSSNEELVASNEELQSTNEELQSVNEELYTVNNEHQLKIDELSELNNDLSNLLKNTEVGALYLDSDLRIRRTTPLFVEITNILETDIGRSIAHISVMDEYPELNEDIDYVMEALDGVEREVQDKNGTYWLMRVRPFRTSNNAVNGVIVTMVDISKLREQIKQTERIKNRLEKILEVGKIAWWEYDLETNYVDYSDSKATMLGYPVDEFPNDVYEICEYIHKDDYDEAMQSMKDYLTGKSEEWDIIYRLKRKDGSYAKIHDRGEISLRNSEGKPLKLIGTVQEV